MKQLSSKELIAGLFGISIMIFLPLFLLVLDKTAFTIILGIINITLYGLSIYCLILFVKLATRGIKVLDLYLEKELQSELEENN